MYSGFRMENAFMNAIKKHVSIISALWFFCSCNNLSEGDDMIDKDMMKAASAINKTCPIMVDSITRFDNAAALTNNTFQFNYTILNADKSDYDTNALIQTVRPLTLNMIKTNPQNKIFRDKETKVSFIYHDSSGKYLCRVLFTPEEYKSN